MELMTTCLDKLMRRLQGPIPENILGKMAVAVSSELKLRLTKGTKRKECLN